MCIAALPEARLNSIRASIPQVAPAPSLALLLSAPAATANHPPRKRPDSNEARRFDAFNTCAEPAGCSTLRPLNGEPLGQQGLCELQQYPRSLRMRGPVRTRSPLMLAVAFGACGP